MAYYAFPTFGPQDQPFEALQRFLDGVREVLDDIATAAPNAPDIFPGNLAALLAAAWEDARPALGRMRDNIPLLSPAVVRAHGLAGPQLAFKLAVVSHANQPFRDAGNYLFGASRSMLRKLLEYLDVLLKSIIKALGGEGAVEEIKEYIEKLLGD